MCFFVEWFFCGGSNENNSGVMLFVGAVSALAPIRLPVRGFAALGGGCL